MQVDSVIVYYTQSFRWGELMSIIQRHLRKHLPSQDTTSTARSVKILKLTRFHQECSVSIQSSGCPWFIVSDAEHVLKSMTWILWHQKSIDPNLDILILSRKKSWGELQLNSLATRQILEMEFAINLTSYRLRLVSTYDVLRLWWQHTTTGWEMLAPFYTGTMII